MSDDHWNPGWERGIRIGDPKTGFLKAFIPDEESREAPERNFWASTEGADFFRRQRPARTRCPRALRPLW